MAVDPYKFDSFVRGYLECALWSSNDESDDRGGEPLDKNFSIEDIDEESLLDMKQDCDEFRANPKVSEALDFIQEHTNYSSSSAGHDFWLTRNGHGTGFQDRAWDYRGSDVAEQIEEAFDVLDKASDEWGEYYLYVDDSDEESPKVSANYTRASAKRYETRKAQESGIRERALTRYTKDNPPKPRKRRRLLEID